MTPQDRAERSAAAMWASDRASKFLGLSLVAVGPGTASMTMEVQDQHLNGHDICHGGFIATLADSAFAYACNSHNQTTVAQSFAVTFVSPGQPGETLTATAQETVKNGRSGVYDITVTGQDGRKVALFRGHSRTITGQNFEETTTL